MGTAVIIKATIAERLTESILAGKLLPGDRLGEQEIADLFEVSRTLVREALMQLRTRGFVEVRSRVGWYVAEPSFEEAQETFAARRVIEPGILRNAGRPCSPRSSVCARILQRKTRPHKEAIPSCTVPCWPIFTSVWPNAWAIAF